VQAKQDGVGVEEAQAAQLVALEQQKKTKDGKARGGALCWGWRGSQSISPLLFCSLPLPAFPRLLRPSHARPFPAGATDWDPTEHSGNSKWAAAGACQWCLQCSCSRAPHAVLKAPSPARPSPCISHNTHFDAFLGPPFMQAAQRRTRAATRSI
jgi:hypothetical protein